MKQKTLFFVLIALSTLLSLSTFAQDNTAQEYKSGLSLGFGNAGMFEKLWLNDYDVVATYPGWTGGNFVMGGNNSVINNFSIGLFGYFSMNADKTLRAKMQIAKNNIHASDDGWDYTKSPPPASGSTFGVGEINTKQTIVNFEPSIVWDNEIKNITIYEGITLPFILIGKYRSDSYGMMVDSSNNAISEGAATNSLPGGLATGLGIVAGLDLTISIRLKLGMELAFAYLYSHIQGEQIVTNTVIVPAYSLETTKGRFTQRRSGFSNLNAAINISYSLK